MHVSGLFFIFQVNIYMFINFFFLLSIDTGLKGDCTVAISDSDFMDMVSGKIGPQKVI